MGFGCVLVIVALVLFFGLIYVFLKARRGGATPSARGPLSCAACGAKNPERVHPCPHCGHGHA